MPPYLAYQFDLDSVPDSKLVQIMNDYFDFEIASRGRLRTAEEWIGFELRFDNINLSSLKWILHEIRLRKIRLTDIIPPYVCFAVKNHPLLNIFFEYKGEKKAYLPRDNFSGLVVRANHSGSENLVELLQFKPEMDAYLHSIGIVYEELSDIRE